MPVLTYQEMIMYQVAVRKRFEARHALIGAKGREADPHAHDYLLELVLEGPRLRDDGYLVDILDIKDALDAALSRYRGRLLNDLVEFEGLNPSLEHFSRILYERLLDRIAANAVVRARLTLWEDDEAWASYAHESSGPRD